MQVEGKENDTLTNRITYTCAYNTCNISFCDGGEIHCLSCSGPVTEAMLAYIKLIKPKIKYARRVLQCKGNTCNINTKDNICTSCAKNSFNKELVIALAFNDIITEECRGAVGCNMSYDDGNSYTIRGTIKHKHCLRCKGPVTFDMFRDYYNKLFA